MASEGCTEWKKAYVTTQGTSSPLWNEIRPGASISYEHMYVFPCTKLVFGEIQSNHDVVLLDSAGKFDQCNFAPDHTEVLDDGGTASFTYNLDKSVTGETLFFACSKSNHCEVGLQKVAVTVLDHDSQGRIFGKQFGSGEFDVVEGVRRRASEASEPFEHPQGQPQGMLLHAFVIGRRCVA